MTGRDRKHVARRRAERNTLPWPSLLAHAIAITASLVAWGYLVWLAIDFGASGRSGDSRAWWLLAVATLGAVACLCVALLLGIRIGRIISAIAGVTVRGTPGGRRAAR